MAGALSGVCQENQERWPQISSYKQYPGFLSARYLKKKKEEASQDSHRIN